MRIAFWNIRAGGGVRVEHIARQLHAWSADVAALSEFRCTAPSGALARALAAQGLAHQHTTARPSGALNCLLLASRWPLTRVRVRAAPAEPGRWLCALVGATRPFTIAGMHVPNRVTGRKDGYYAGVIAALARWRRGPALVGGDTNSGRPVIDEETPVFGPREVAWLDALERLGWADTFRRVHGDARAYTWYSPNGRNGFRIDQAFANPALLPRVSDAHYDWGKAGGGPPSDHAALLVDLDD